MQCPHCQHPITLSSPPPPLPPQRTPKKPANKFVLKFFAIFLGVIALFVLICMAMVNATNESEERAIKQIAVQQRENEEAIKNHHVLMGMTAAQVREAWGEPKRIIRTVTERAEREEWIYGRSSLFR